MRASHRLHSIPELARTGFSWRIPPGIRAATTWAWWTEGSCATARDSPTATSRPSIRRSSRRSRPIRRASSFPGRTVSPTRGAFPASFIAARGTTWERPNSCRHWTRGYRDDALRTRALPRRGSRDARGIHAPERVRSRGFRGRRGPAREPPSAARGYRGRQGDAARPLRAREPALGIDRREGRARDLHGPARVRLAHLVRDASFGADLELHGGACDRQGAPHG